jgi:hypothetical protein
MHQTSVDKWSLWTVVEKEDVRSHGRRFFKGEKKGYSSKTLERKRWIY